MSVYESMLLERGGGIFPDASENSSNRREHGGEAGLVIGLGGTGAAALEAVRDHFAQERATISGIRFLTVDADTGTAPDSFSLLSVREGHPSTRQRGRAMIVRRAPQLRERLLELCRSALEGKDADSLSVFILAGLSGITGGSCLMDLCYIVRSALGELGSDFRTQIHGIFFLPDVAQSSPAVFGHRDVVERRFENACGYAALSEMNGLMQMRGSGRRFQMQYDENISVDTDERPVDFFCLISASNEYGSLSSNAYESCLGTAAGYVTEYLRMPEDARCRWQESRKTDDPYYVTMPGVSRRFLPLVQVSTAAASRFCLEFQKNLKERREDGPTYASAREAALSIGLETEKILEAVTRGCPDFEFPDVSTKELRSCGAMSDGEFPSVWSQEIEEWLEECARIRKENSRGLREKFRDGLTAKINRDMNAPGRGPYYVRDFLAKRGSDIREIIHECREDVRDRLKLQKESLYGRNGRGGIVTEFDRASADFVRSGIFGRNRKYERYVEAAQKLMRAENEILMLTDVRKLLKKTDAFVRKYEKNYIEPVLEIIENLSETASANLKFLEKQKTVKGGFAKPFFRREDLELVRQDIDFDQFSREFLAFLQTLSGQTGYIKNAQRRVGGWLSATFGSLSLSCADEYIVRMQEQVQRAILRLLHRTAGQLFCDADKARTQLVFLSVPKVPSSLYELAQRVRGESVLYSASSDEISVLRIREGIPLSCCRELPQMEKEYEPYRNSVEMNLELL